MVIVTLSIARGRSLEEELPYEKEIKKWLERWVLPLILPYLTVIWFVVVALEALKKLITCKQQFREMQADTSAKKVRLTAR